MLNYNDLYYLSESRYSEVANNEIDRLSKLDTAVNRMYRFSVFLYPSLSNLPVEIQEEVEKNFRTAFIKCGGKPYTTFGQKSNIARLYQIWYRTLLLQKAKLKMA
jgi:hypothetical protein